jgi:outer membrane lipoprotein-sorting protein
LGFATKLKKPALAVIVLLFLKAVSGCASSQTAAPLDFDSLVNDVEKKSEFVKQFRADFVKTRTSNLFAKPITVVGKLIFQKPHNFCLTLTGDVNVEIVSNGQVVSLIHDSSDREIFHIQGERDASRFADPLMVLLDNISKGGLRNFAPVSRQESSDELVIQFRPLDQPAFERIDQMRLVLNDSGQINKVAISYKNGNMDEVEFKSWMLLTSDDPEIDEMNKKIDDMLDFVESGKHFAPEMAKAPN